MFMTRTFLMAVLAPAWAPGFVLAVGFVPAAIGLGRSQSVNEGPGPPCGFCRLRRAGRLGRAHRGGIDSVLLGTCHLGLLGLANLEARL